MSEGVSLSRPERTSDTDRVRRDERDFLSDRNVMSPHDLPRPDNGHWLTLPTLVYRLLWRTVGLNSYKPRAKGVLARLLHTLGGLDPGQSLPRLACLERCTDRVGVSASG